MKKIFGILLIISISLSFLVISIEKNTYDKEYYLESYKKYNVKEVTNKSMEELESITDKLILYLKDRGGEELLSPHYNEREILHMEDVKDLFNLARLIKYIGIIISFFIIWYFANKRQYRFLQKTITWGLFSNHIAFLLLTALASTNFNKYFTYFHLIFFDNDLWLLNPKTDLLIQMLPEPFFVGIAIRILLSFLLYLSIIQILSYFFIERGKEINERYNKKLFLKK